MDGSRGISLRYVYLTLAVCSITVLGVVAYALRTGVDMSANLAPLASAALQMKLEATTAHLWFEEVVSGDRNESIDVVWTHLDNAEQCARAMLDGARTPQHTVVPLDDARLRGEIENALVKLHEFRGIAEKRLESISEFGPGSELDQEFDAIFDSLLDQADVVQVALRGATAQELVSFRNTQGALLVACLLATVFLAGVFYRFGTLNEEAFVAVRNAEDRARAGSQRISAILRGLGDAVIATDAAGEVIAANPAAAALTGWSIDEALGHALNTVLILEPGSGNGSARDMLLSVLESKDLVGWEDVSMVSRDGRRHPVDCCGAPIVDDRGTVSGMVVSFRDIAERQATEAELSSYRTGLEQLVEERTKELEKSHEQLQRSQRLAAIGTLAAGIAHEINNPLGMILLETGRALECGGMPDQARTLLGRSQEHARRCGRIVKGVLRFAREQPSEKISVDVNEVVRYSVSLAAGYASERGVGLEVNLAADLPRVMANRVELEQVLMNLVRNGVQACAGAGQVTVATFDKSGSVCLVVRDDGRGLTEKELEHAFDPFYTTRLSQGGTGLGLSTVHGIIADHDGTIDISSEPGHGAVVSVTLPAGLRRQLGNGDASGNADGENVV